MRERIKWVFSDASFGRVAGQYWPDTKTIEVFGLSSKKAVIRHELVHYFFDVYNVDVKVLLKLITDLYYGPKDGNYRKLYKALGLTKEEIAIVEQSEYYLDEMVADSFEQMAQGDGNSDSAMAIAEARFAAELVVQMERNSGIDSAKAREKVLEIHSWCVGTLVHEEEYYLLAGRTSARKVFEYAALKGAEETVANMAAGGLNCFGLKVLYKAIKKYLPAEVRLMIETATAEIGEEVEPDWSEYC
ncbi:MAG: hypothetical protein QXE80_08835 [Pyrobaculum sp.]